MLVNREQSRLELPIKSLYSLHEGGPQRITMNCRIPPSHGENRGSIPLGSAKIKQAHGKITHVQGGTLETAAAARAVAWALSCCHPALLAGREGARWRM